MKTYDIFKEYIWLVQTIHRRKRISLEEINELWRETDMSGGMDFNRITFSRHKDAIQDIFGLFIECDRKNGYKYYIGNSHVLDEDSVQNWLLSTLSVNNIISESLSIQNRIQIESIPDDRFLAEMIEAMKKNRRVEVAYRRFGAEDSKTLTFDPYALKVYQKRWYVLGHFQRPAREGETPIKRRGLPEGYIEYFGTFSFDRIETVSILKEKFKIAPNFSVKEFFHDCYGIVQGDSTEAQKVAIRAYGREAYNMRTLPLHHSQKEINTTYDYSDFELYLKPTLDFSGKLLSRGEYIEILEPEWLKENVIQRHIRSVQRYGRTFEEKK